jgi:uncharacterized protein (TIGR00369 family)
MSLLDRPYAKTMGFGEMRDKDGRLVVYMDFDDILLGRPGHLHGGAIAGLLESAGFATLTEAIGETPAPLLKPVNVTVTYMRGGLEKRTFARATIERLGRRIANIEVTAWQDDPAKPIALAQMNMLIDRSAPPLAR